MSSNHKPIRSRFSSPLHSSSPSGHNRGLAGEGQRTFMQRWLEPPLQNKASFQEAGLIRGGVVENMAPLGTLPKSMMHKKSPVNGDAVAPPPVKTRIVLKKPYTNSATRESVPRIREQTPAEEVEAAVDAEAEAETEATEEAADTTEAETADVETTPLSPLSQPLLPIPVMDDGADEDYVPKKSKSRPSNHRVINISPSNHATRRHSSRRRSARTSPTPTPTPSHLTTPVGNHQAANSSSTPLSSATAAPAAAVNPTTSITSTTTITTPFNSAASSSFNNTISFNSATTPFTSTPLIHSTAAPTNITTTTTAPSTIRAVTPPGFQAPPSVLNRDEPDKELADKVVEAAVDEALLHYRYPTAWALRLLYDENSSDPHFVSMIEDIYYQRADIETQKEFSRLVYYKKKDGKKENKGCDYFVPPSTDTRVTPHKPKPAPYGDLIRMDLSTFHEQQIHHHQEDDHLDEELLEEGHINKKIKLDEDAIEDDDASTNTPTKANGTGDHKGLTNTNKSPNKSIRGRKTRSGSASSSSTLSSVPDDVPDDYEEFMDQVDDDLSVVRPMAAEPNNAQIPVGSAQPISDQEKKPAAAKKKNGASPKHPLSQSTPAPAPNPTSNINTPLPPSRDSSMPAAIVVNGHQESSRANSLDIPKYPSKFGVLEELPDSFPYKKKSKKCETASITKESSEDSYIRDHLGEDDSLPFELAVPPPPPAIAAATEQGRASRTPALSSRAARAAKRNHDELNESISPTALSFKTGDIDSSFSARNSRAATPSSNLRSSKKTRAGLRVKTSPMKKKSTAAGIPRSHGDRPSPVGNGPNHQDDNDDSCYTCGCDGELVCCDGCRFSFHYMCIDPPLEEEPSVDEWYCNECKTRRGPPPPPYPYEDDEPVIFKALLTSLEGKNPSSFRLPEDIRDLFEGVQTGLRGDYEEPVAPKPKTNKKTADEPFDFFKVRNANGPVLCHHCHRGSMGNRPILPCSICGLNWHLECLDPPLAVPPVPRTWKCPCHVDDILANLPERLGPAHRYRKLKDAPVIEQVYSRGLANNGWIEIDNDDSDDDDEGWRQYRGFGHVFRLSEKGIKQDFITNLRKKRPSANAPVSNPNPVPASTSAAAVQASVPTLEEQQVALSLAQLAQGGANDGMSMLHQAMISEASPAVISMMASGSAQHIAKGNLASVDKVSLEAMLAQAEVLSKGIRDLLQNKSKENQEDTTSNVAVKETKRKSPVSANEKAIVKDGKDEDADTKPVMDDSAMQID
ncbi:uncharacterized protein F4822DRAFT_17293 [Hypoxylon trugodes]|uniref:uncharacterized protein n=1 Tax=Hypoxylon trugodes TaxID=326681 RepID=UPI00219297C8|nr:uncharacterized protein F4822DRAFT_17293 [Hypoxylon trugodes]KAI1393579.1 hypothetical protein F4822DRAFT_17293 [Hypoxylon trugodes]